MPAAWIDAIAVQTAGQKKPRIGGGVAGYTGIGEAMSVSRMVPSSGLGWRAYPVRAVFTNRQARPDERLAAFIMET